MAVSPHFATRCLMAFATASSSTRSWSMHAPTSPRNCYRTKATPSPRRREPAASRNRFSFTPTSKNLFSLSPPIAFSVKPSFDMRYGTRSAMKWARASFSRSARTTPASSRSYSTNWRINVFRANTSLTLRCGSPRRCLMRSNSRLTLPTTIFSAQPIFSTPTKRVKRASASPSA